MSFLAFSFRLLAISCMLCVASSPRTIIISPPAITIIFKIYDLYSSFKLSALNLQLPSALHPKPYTLHLYLYSPNTCLNSSAISPSVQKFSTASITAGIRFSPLTDFSCIVCRHAFAFDASRLSRNAFNFSD